MSRVCRFLHSQMPTREQRKKTGAKFGSGSPVGVSPDKLFCPRSDTEGLCAPRCHGTQALRRGLTVKSRT